MLKNLSFIAVAGLLASGCVIDLGNTTTATATDSTTEGTTGGSTGGSTTTATTGGTTTDGTGTGTTAPTTTAPTTTDGTTGTTGTTSTGTTSTTGTTGGSAFGMCGWNGEQKYYACPTDGGSPGVSDPDNISPIACPDMLPTVGDKCDDTTPVNNVGCCTPEGVNWFCSQGAVAMEDCGA